MRLRLVGRAFELAQGRLGAIEKPRLEVIQREGVLGPIAVGLAQVAACHQVLVNTYGALEFAAPAKQIAQGEMQFGRVRIVLNRFNEGVNRLVLLLIEQVVQALEIGLGGLPVLQPQLT